jgi:Flp pilus assembly protein TadB
MVGLTLFAEFAAAVACGGLSFTLAEFAGLRNKLEVALSGAAAGFFIAFVAHLGMPLLALPVAVIATAGLDRWIDRSSRAQFATQS